MASNNKNVSLRLFILVCFNRLSAFHSSPPLSTFYLDLFAVIIAIFHQPCCFYSALQPDYQFARCSSKSPIFLFLWEYEINDSIWYAFQDPNLNVFRYTDNFHFNNSFLKTINSLCNSRDTISYLANLHSFRWHQHLLTIFIAASFIPYQLWISINLCVQFCIKLSTQPMLFRNTSESFNEIYFY